MFGRYKISFIYCLFFSSIFFILLWINWGLIISPTIPSGDLAADMLLANRIRDEGWLLVGHYSRYNFNHPGPFWFYYNHLIETLLQWTSLSRYHCWVMGSILINTFFISFSAFSLSTYLLNKINVYFSLVFTFIFIGLLGSIITNLWMPNRLICPFLAYLICVLHISRGHYKYLAVAIFLAGILIHGYITMPFFTLPFLLLAITLGCHNKFTTSTTIINQQIRYSIIFIILFLLPLLFDFMLHHPNNITRILTARTALINAPMPSWQQMGVFINTFILKNHYILWLFVFQIICLYPLAISSNNELKKRIGIAYVLCILYLALIILLYKHTPAPINPYTAQFFLAVPVIFIGATLSLYFNTCKPNIIKKFSRIIIFFTSILILSSAHKAGSFTNTYQKSIISFANILEKKNIKTPKLITLSAPDHSLWSLMAGLLLELDRRHIKACTIERSMSTVYTAKEICRKSAVARFEIVYSNECKEKCNVKNNTFALNETITLTDVLKKNQRR